MGLPSLEVDRVMDCLVSKELSAFLILKSGRGRGVVLYICSRRFLYCSMDLLGMPNTAVSFAFRRGGLGIGLEG